MAKPRAYGADAALKGKFETTYGAFPASGFTSLDFKSIDLSAAQPLGDDPLLGRGRNVQDPFRDLITDEGSIEIPWDLQGSGFWLKGVFGAPVTTQVKATGMITFSGQPGAGSTITLNGVAWTFVASGASGNETNIQGSLSGTLTQLASDLNASANTSIDDATYTSTATQLIITHDTLGTAGNAYTLAASAASNGTVSAPNLTGGGYSHVFKAGSDDIPSIGIEIGHPKLVTPIFFRHSGVVLESVAFDLGQSGPANARIAAVAQGEASFGATIDAAPTPFVLRRFSQGRGFVRRGGAALAGLTGGNFNFTNTLERVRGIRDDGKIDGADPTLAAASGQITARFDGATLVAEAADGDPIELEYGYSFADTGHKLEFAMDRVFLPKPKYAVSGPGGVEAAYDWRAAYDPTATTSLTATLLNDVASY